MDISKRQFPDPAHHPPSAWPGSQLGAGPAAASQRLPAEKDAVGWTEDRASGAVRPQQSFIPVSCTRFLVALSSPAPAPRVPHPQQRQTGDTQSMGRWSDWLVGAVLRLSRSICSRKISTFGCRDFQASKNAVLIIKHLLCICLSSCRDVAPALALPSLSVSTLPGPGQHPLLTALPQPGDAASWAVGAGRERAAPGTPGSKQQLHCQHPQPSQGCKPTACPVAPTSPNSFAEPHCPSPASACPCTVPWAEQEAATAILLPGEHQNNLQIDL